MSGDRWFEKCEELELEVESLNRQLEIMKELVADLVGIDMETLEDEEEEE
jgi:hypothetical protein